MTESTAAGRTARNGSVRWSDGGRFGVLPLWVLDTEISDRAKVLYAHLAALAGAEQATVRGHAEMERWLRCGRTSVRNALAELVEISAITIEETRSDTGGQGRNSYVVHVTPPLQASEGGGPRPGDELPLGDPEELERETASPGEGVALASPPGPDRSLFRVTKVGGRDLPFDTLQRVCRIRDDSPRRREVASALNGAGAGRAAGIRELAYADWPGSGDEPLARDPRAFERWLCEEIERKARAYVQMMPKAMLTPMALAKWWADVGSSESAAERAMRIGREALEERRDP